MTSSLDFHAKIQNTTLAPHLGSVWQTTTTKKHSKNHPDSSTKHHRDPSTEAMAPISALINFAIAFTSAYCLYHSAQSIPKLRKYESKAEKAAKWSNTAEKRLWDTRYTVGAGFTMVNFQNPHAHQQR